MNYKETLEYLFNSLPMFHRVGAAAYKANLDNTYKLMGLTGHPYKRFKSIHIAGTNGKGSNSHFLASIMQEQGLKTGLYTSPHLKDFRERIKINGVMISEEEVVGFVEKYKSNFEEIQPSFFEMTVAMAFSYFAKEKVDIAIIETGLGGRLDSTNVIHPLLSIITNIDFDHTALLGNSLVEIAGEKAGIIKKNVPVVIGESSAETDSVFIQKAILEDAQIVFADKVNLVEDVEMINPFLMNFKIGNYNLSSPLAGKYQLKNLVTVCTAIDHLNNYSDIQISSENVELGVRNVIKNTQFVGRWHRLNESPLAIADTGHNPHGLSIVLKQLEELQAKTLHFVLGMVNDKDIDLALSMMPKNAVYYFCKADIPRGLNQESLSLIAQKFGLHGSCYSSVNEAYQVALKNAKPEDVVFVGGSTFTVAEVV